MGAWRLGAGLLAFGIACAVAAPPPAGALEFDNGGAFERARHERFLPDSFPAAPVPNPDFFLAGHELELTGVGWQTDAPRKKAALISPLHFLNASHYKLGGSITFLGRDGALHTRTIVRNVKVYQDVAIGTLAEPLPDEVYFFPVVPVVGAETLGREVLYVGRAPGGNAFAAGRTAVAYSSGSGSSLDSRGVDPQWTQDRVRGVSGDSGSPSFVDEGGFLGLLGHHFAAYNDLYIGYGPARDAADDALAADGHLLDVIGEGRQAAGDLVATRLSAEGALELEALAPGALATRRFRIHDFSGSGAEAQLRVSDPAFGLIDPATGAPGQALRVSLPADASGTSVELSFAGPEGSHAGILSVETPGSLLEIPLRSQVADLGLRPVELELDPGYASGRSGDAGIAGDTRVYTLLARNADSAGQPSALLDLSARAPQGWALALEPASLSLAPGQQHSAELRVTPAAGAVPDSYAFHVELRDAAEPAHDARVTGVYEVTGVLRDETAPSAPTDLDASGRWKQIQLSWTASRDDVAVAGYAVLRDGVPIGITDATSYADGPLERGRSYRYSVRAFDAAGNASPESAPLEISDGRVTDSRGGGGDAGSCRRTRSREVGRFCRDGVDNDCDGFADAADPDC